MGARASSSRGIVPIFVIGSQRSGTTMLGAMLGSHSRGVAVPESAFFQVDAPEDPATPVDLAAAVRKWRDAGCFDEYDLDPDRSPEGVGTHADAVRWVIREQAAAVGRPDPAFWVDHAPLNTFYVPTILAHFPEARFTHLLRDGRAVAASMLPLWWGPMTVHEAAAAWQRFVASALAAAHCAPPESYVGVRFEDLVEDPEPALRRIMAAVGFDYEPGMATGSGYKVPETTRHHHELVGSAPQANRAEAWRRALTRRQIEIFEYGARGLLETLGYAPVHRRPRKPSRAEVFYARLAAARARLLRRPPR
jgi:hypothetical protein